MTRSISFVSILVDSSTHAPHTWNYGTGVPTASQVELLANRLRLMSKRDRKYAIAALQHVLPPTKPWRVPGETFLRSVPAIDPSNEAPDLWCRWIARSSRNAINDPTFAAVRDAAVLVVAWYAQRCTASDDACMELLETLFDVLRHTERPVQHDTRTPTETEQRSRCCAASALLCAYVQRRLTTVRTYQSRNEFKWIREFLDETEQGRELLHSAGVDEYELDHYFPETLGGTSVLENAHIMPRTGVNQRFGGTFSSQKRTYCGEVQHDMFKKHARKCIRLA